MKRRGDVARVYLKPAEIHLSKRPAAVSTVLGSCVSVTMFHRRGGVGAICHGLLPRCRENGECGADCADNFKYMDCSISRMLEEFERMGIPRREIEVKVFGGADMIGGDGLTPAKASVGHQNVDEALRLIREKGLTLITSDTGGAEGRKIIFYTHTGDVFLKRLKKAE